MKKLFCILALVGAGWLVYVLFQPIFDHSFGWNELMPDVYDQHFTGVEDLSYQTSIDRAKHLVDSIHQSNKLPSISIATMIDGNLVWSYVSGFQNIEEQIPADTATLYRIGSVSKALTSLGLGVMIQNNSIHIDSSVQYYTDRFRDKPRITVRQLASHQSGIRNYGTCFCFPIWEYYRNKAFESVEESILDFEQDKLLFEPGSSFYYSSYNFTALSLAMEKAAGMQFNQLMQRTVFHPLGMKHTKPDLGASENQSVPYETDVALYKKAPIVNLSNKWAGGGLLSTPSDLVRAGNALLDSLLLNPETTSLLTTPQKLNNDSINAQSYALGWRHSISNRYFEGAQKVEVIHHGGMAVGGLALLVVYPEYNMSIAITINTTGKEGNFELFDYLTPIAEAFLRKMSL